METKDFSGLKLGLALPNPENIIIPNDIEDLLGDYIESTSSLLEELEKAALAYEMGYNPRENAACIRRVLHKIKGEASMVGLEDITKLSHQAEDAFEQLQENKRVDMLLKFKDWTLTVLEKLSKL